MNITKSETNLTEIIKLETFKTKLLEDGCSITIIMKLLGYSSLKITLIYLDLSDDLVFQYYEHNKFIFFPL